MDRDFIVRWISQDSIYKDIPSSFPTERSLPAQSSSATPTDPTPIEDCGSLSAILLVSSAGSIGSSLCVCVCVCVCVRVCKHVVKYDIK